LEISLKPTRILIGSGVLLLLMFGLWGPGDLEASGPAATTESVLYQLLANPGMEFYDPPYNPGMNCQVASGWERFWYDGEDPCFMDTRVFAATVGSGWVERIEGETSQMIVSTEPYTAGIYQRVTGLTPGTGYGFHAAMLTIFGSSVPPAYHGMMNKQVGIDPTGGIDPQAGTVVWSEPDDHDEGPWDVRRRTAAYAQGPAMTVFVRVISPYASGDPSLLNQSFLDSAILARTASVQAVSPSASADRTFTVRWENALPSPGGEIRWYDVQWMDEDEGTWHEWFEQTVDTQSTFTGERGHTYRFRARAWQRYPNGAHLFSPYRTDGDTETYVQGPELVGRVQDHEGHSVAGATVSISGTTYSAVSGSGGRYRIKLLPSSEAQSVTISHPQWQSPAPVHGVTFGPMEVVTIDWSLRPPDDAVSNGGFEEGLAGWSLVDEQGAEPVVVAEPVHTGLGALALGGSAGGSYTAGVTQTAVLTDAWEPVLSFWYRPETTDAGDDVFNVSLTVVTGTVRSGPSLRSLLVPDLGVTRVFTPSLEGSGWQHLSLYPLPEGYYSATVTIEFEMWNDGDASSTTVYLDEVDLAPTRGGPYKYYLPLTQR
jgi:hypothetical protein